MRLSIRFLLVFCFYLLLGIFLFSISLCKLSAIEFSYYDIMLLYRFDIISNDLYLIFYYYFIQSPVIILYISFLIGLMSIIFSCLYFCISRYKFLTLKYSNSIFIIRRQQLVRQSNYN